MPSESCIAGLRFAGCGYEYNLTNASPSHSFDHGPLLAPRPLRGKYRRIRYAIHAILVKTGLSPVTTVRGNHGREPRQSLTVPPPRKKKKRQNTLFPPQAREFPGVSQRHTNLSENKKSPTPLPVSNPLFAALFRCQLVHPWASGHPAATAKDCCNRVAQIFFISFFCSNPDLLLF
ncbi:hypothetical protein J3E68DRAFT_144609 [Trichoderma sp. SZMC 28012]